MASELAVQQYNSVSDRGSSSPIEVVVMPICRHMAVPRAALCTEQLYRSCQMLFKDQQRASHQNNIYGST
jgi:hypothetical protein